jgi:hypothetical protein
MNERWQLTRCWEKMGGKGEASAGVSFYRGRREGEEAIVVPHIGVQTSMTCQTGWSTTCIRFPSPESLIGGPQSGLQTWREPESAWAALSISRAH